MLLRPDVVLLAQALGVMCPLAVAVGACLVEGHAFRAASSALPVVVHLAQSGTEMLPVAVGLGAGLHRPNALSIRNVSCINRNVNTISPTQGMNLHTSEEGGRSPRPS